MSFQSAIFQIARQENIHLYCSTFNRPTHFHPTPISTTSHFRNHMFSSGARKGYSDVFILFTRPVFLHSNFPFSRLWKSNFSFMHPLSLQQVQKPPNAYSKLGMIHKHEFSNFPKSLRVGTSCSLHSNIFQVWNWAYELWLESYFLKQWILLALPRP